MDTVTLNVGGSIFMIRKSLLQKLPGTRLAEISPNNEEYNLEKGWYFFDRNPEIVNSILDLYRTEGLLHLPKHLCGATVEEELQFWKIPPSTVADCCFSTISQYEGDKTMIERIKCNIEKQGGPVYTEEELCSSCWNQFKSRIWTFLHTPSSSTGAQVFSCLYLTFVILTCLTFILMTHPWFRSPYNPITMEINGTTIQSDWVEFMMNRFNNPKVALLFGTKEQPFISHINFCAMIFFGLDLTFRFVSCPSKTYFFRDILNLSEILILTSTMISFVFEYGIFEKYKLPESWMWFYACCKAVVIFRLLRLFRLSKHFEGLKILYLALKASAKELALMLVSFFIFSILFAGLAYYAEFYDPDSFENVPIALWWSIITMTTVGYGDVSPTTLPGYIVGSLCAISGLLILAMPVAIIANNFGDHYHWNRIRRKKVELIGAQAADTLTYFCCTRIARVRDSTFSVITGSLFEKKLHN
ncbi:hypothetical protein CHS0354_012740 [Potamilus streckersoni]|uniref:BTB domain-containing protein n=1 Tax=Potamilus streckersoni TaxID=2493646 RepID=A0AAE0SY53_9BIVA|nr:hypothetical protein CHS0354_012740 [Potamilus streckersoni]